MRAIVGHTFDYRESGATVCARSKTILMSSIIFITNLGPAKVTNSEIWSEREVRFGLLEALYNFKGRIFMEFNLFNRMGQYSG